MVKFLIFRQHIKLSRNEEASLSEICLSNVLIYFRIWVEAPKDCDAAANDLASLDDLYIVRYNAVNKKISKAALTTFLRHLWYL